MLIDHNPEYDKEPNWSLDDCIRRHDEAYQLREMREEMNFRYRDRELKDAMPRKINPESSVTQYERNAYHKEGSSSLQKTSTERLCEAIFLLLLLMFGAWIVHFME